MKCRHPLLLCATLFLKAATIAESHKHSFRHAQATEDIQHEHRHDHTCGTESPNDEQKAEDSMHMQRWELSSLRKNALCVGCVTIDVVFHVFTDGQPTASDAFWWERSTDELFTESGIAHQMQVLNSQFSDSPFQFNLLATNTILDPDLANTYQSASPNYLDEIKSYRTGGGHVANVYWFQGYCEAVGSTQSVSMRCGQARFPTSGGLFPDGEYWSDDYIYMCPLCMSNPDSLDANAATLVHEIGHWLGLYHTFEGQSCTGEGDRVDDTPQQKSYSWDACNFQLDTCPNAPGFDPSSNYMNYGRDECQTEFTPGQISRMWAQWNEYRAKDPICESTDFVATTRMRYGSGATTSSDTLFIRDEVENTQFYMLSSFLWGIDYSGEDASVSKCLTIGHVHKLFMKLNNHGITNDFYVAQEIAGVEIYRATNKFAVLYFYVEESLTTCPTGSALFKFEMFGTRGDQISWTLKQGSSTTISDPFPASVDTWEATFLSFHCIFPGTYTFRITDSGGNGITSTGGYYRILEGDSVLHSGGNFATSEEVVITVVGDGPSPTTLPVPAPTQPPVPAPTQPPVPAPTQPPVPAPTQPPVPAPTQPPVPAPTQPPAPAPTQPPAPTPTQPPVPAPTQPQPAPTLPPVQEEPTSPTPTPPSCFSGRNHVTVKDRGQVRMKDVRVGDKVLVTGGKYEPVYSFCKRSTEMIGEYIQVFVTEHEEPLELTGNHLVFIVEQGEGGQQAVAISASRLEIGNALFHEDTGELMTVSKLQTVQRHGVYAPYTASGTIVVNGVLASTYATLSDGILSKDSQELLHFAQTHHRLLCSWFPTMCRRETYSEDEDGLSPISKASLHIYQLVSSQKYKVVTWYCSANIMIGLGLLRALELFTNCSWGCCIVAFVFLVWRFKLLCQKEKKQLL